jgi:hypothetical protein
VRAASGLRLRVALALDSTPAPGAPFDGTALQSMVAELDAVLGRLKAAAEAAPPDTLSGLEVLRKELVRQAIDLTETAQRLAPAGTPVPVPVAVRQAPGQPATRLLWVNKAQGAPRRVPVGLLVALGMIAVAAGAYHLQRYLSRAPPPSFSYEGAPRDAIAVKAGPGKPTVIVKPKGSFEAAEIERLRAQEELRGRTVQQLAPGTVLVLPAGAPQASKPGAQPATPRGGKP